MQQGPFAPRALPRFNATTDPAATVSSSTVFPGPPSRSEESQMSQSRMSVVWNSRFQKHYSQRILQNEVRETPSIPVRRVRKDVLLDERHALLPSPTSKSYFR